jgi:predicted ATP-grasp superfamily ATP-dependent carboligase
LVLPSPLQNPDEFLDSLKTCVKEEGINVVLPVTEASLSLLSERRECLGETCLPIPPHENLQRVLRKDEVAQVARRVGLSVPRQFLWEDRSASPPAGLPFPLVVKPSRSVVGPPGERRKVFVSYAESERELEPVLERYPADAWPILLQERITGPGVGLFFLIWDQSVLARFAHRRIREKPPSGGVSVLREAVDVPEEWYQWGAELLRQMGWYGVAMVELKWDLVSGDPYVMEVNPRFWGSLQLAVDAGVDFPALFLSAVLGEQVAPVLSHKSGVQTRWVMGDVDHLYLMLTRSRKSLNLPSDAPGRLGTVASFLAALRPSVRNEVFRLRDPLPGVFEVGQWFRGL